MDMKVIGQTIATAALDTVKTERPELIAEKKELKEACQGFEAILLNTLMKSMRSSLPGDDIFGGDNAMEIYKSMHDEFLSEKLAAAKGGVGLGELLYKDLEKNLK